MTDTKTPDLAGTRWQRASGAGDSFPRVVALDDNRSVSFPGASPGLRGGMWDQRGAEVDWSFTVGPSGGPEGNHRTITATVEGDRMHCFEEDTRSGADGSGSRQKIDVVYSRIADDGA